MATAPIKRNQNNLGPTEANKYSVGNLTYPLDLHTNKKKYADCWVMININVQDNKASGIEGTKTTLTANEKARRLPYGLEGVDPAKGAATAGIIAAATAGVSQIKDYLNSGKNSPVNVAKAAGNALLAGGVASIPFLAAKAMGKRSATRIKEAIQLPMPNQLSTSYSMQWGEANTNMFDLASRLPEAGMETIKKIGTGDLSSATNLGDAGSAFVLATEQFAGGGAVSAITGLAANPKKEMIFNSVDFREFTMEYKFYPKSRQEAEQLQNLIYTLKYHMHPSYMTESKFTFIYPSEFDITFYSKGANENLFVNKIATCVLQNMTVNSTPEAVWAAHEDGVPNGVSIMLRFKELSILTKESIKIGY